MKDSEHARIERLEGQTAAIGLVLQALIEGLPNNIGLIETIHERAEQMQARLLQSVVPDSVREGSAAWIAQWVPKRQRLAPGM